MRACTSILLPFRQVSAWKMEDGGREEMAMAHWHHWTPRTTVESLKRRTRSWQVLPWKPPPFVGPERARN